MMTDYTVPDDVPDDDDTVATVDDALEVVVEVVVDETPGSSPGNTYEVVGTQRVHGVSRGGTLSLDPDSAHTERLIRAGHIRPANADEQGD
jgi:hypothetical protein